MAKAEARVNAEGWFNVYCSEAMARFDGKFGGKVGSNRI
jgi:hypothetical protein